LLSTYPLLGKDIPDTFGEKLLNDIECTFPITATKIIAIDMPSIAFFRSIPPSKADNTILLDDPGFSWSTHLF